MGFTHIDCLPAPSDVTWAEYCPTVERLLRGVAGTRCLVTIHRNHIAQQELFISLTAFHPSIVCFHLKGKSRCAYH